TLSLHDALPIYDKAGYVRGGGRLREMNLKLSGVGAEPKKIAILVGLGAIAGYFYFSNSNSGGSTTPAPASTAQPAAGPRAATRSGGRAAVRVTQTGLNQT